MFVAATVVNVVVSRLRVFCPGSNAKRLNRDQRPLGKKGSMLHGNLLVMYMYGSWHFNNIVIFALMYGGKYAATAALIIVVRSMPRRPNHIR